MRKFITIALLVGFSTSVFLARVGNSSTILTDSESSRVCGGLGFQCYSYFLFAECSVIDKCLTTECGDIDIDDCVFDYARDQKDVDNVLGCAGDGSWNWGNDCQEWAECFGSHACSDWVSWCQVFYDEFGIPYCVTAPPGGWVNNASAPDGCETIPWNNP